MNRPRISCEGDRVIMRQSDASGREQCIEIEASEVDDVMGDLQRLSSGGPSRRESMSGLDAEEERQDSFGRL